MNMSSPAARPGPDATRQVTRREPASRGRGRIAGRLQASDVIAMFPTLVWKLQVDDRLRDSLGVACTGMLADMRRTSPPISPGQGWQSETALHERAELRDLIACIRHVANGILRFLRIGDEKLEITGCWATVLAPGAVHRAHSHPNNFLSGVYYLRTATGADTINFHDPRVQARVIRPPVVALTAENTDQVVVRVRDGTLLVFPSWLEHSVDANASPRERISISFNLMFPAFAETLAKPLW
jgi:uncharacterized protein (TIGR02466 family)